VAQFHALPAASGVVEFDAETMEFVEWRPYTNPKTGKSGWISEGGMIRYGDVPKKEQEKADRRATAEQAVANAIANPDRVTDEHLPGIKAHLDTLPRDTLRAMAKSLRQKVGGKKADLADRLLASVRGGDKIGDAIARDDAPTPRADLPGGNQAKLKPKAESRLKPVPGIITDVNRMIEIQADNFERLHGWKDGHTREGFVKNWKKTLRGTKPEKGDVINLTPSVVAAFRDHDIPAVPVFIRKQTADERAGGENAHWDNGFVVLSTDAIEERKYRSQVKALDSDRKSTVKESYDDVITGLIVHELGHKHHDDNPDSLKIARGIMADPAERKRVASLISDYASSRPVEMVAEAYAMLKHPRFETLPDETKSLVRRIVTGGKEEPKKPDPIELQPAYQSDAGPLATEDHIRDIKDRHPSLVPLIESGGLQIHDADHPVVKQNLADLARVPPKVHEKLKAAGLNKVYVANAPMTGIDDMGRLKGMTPRNWPPGYTWDSLKGCYDPSNKNVISGNGLGGGASVTLHEYGHAVEKLTGLHDDPETHQWHRDIYETLSPYLKGNGPASDAGRSEMLAESFAVYHTEGKVELAVRHGIYFADWFESKMKELEK
jgi:hypothetical protein